MTKSVYHKLINSSFYHCIAWYSDTETSSGTTDVYILNSFFMESIWVNFSLSMFECIVMSDFLNILLVSMYVWRYLIAVTFKTSVSFKSSYSKFLHHVYRYRYSLKNFLNDISHISQNVSWKWKSVQIIFGFWVMWS